MRREDVGALRGEVLQLAPGQPALVPAPPVLEGYDIVLADDHTLEIEVSKEQNLNEIFQRLSALGIEVLSMRNKVNRLEEVFMRLVEAKSA